MDNFYASLIERSMNVIPGGINSCIRNYPRRFITVKSEGPYFWDQNGKRYTDYLAAFGPMIAGYNNETINRKVADAVNTAFCGVGVTENEVVLAEKICKHVKGVEKVLFCNGGSDATFHALRLARAITGREKIVKTQGSFHGWHDYVLMNNLTMPEHPGDIVHESDGMLKCAADKAIICRINDLEDFRSACQRNKGEIAALILDLGAATIGCMRLKDDYIRGVRQICDEEGIILIFDEVVTGFRVALGGASSSYDVEADLVTMGKAMANGYPIAAVGGKAKYMDCFGTNPGGDVNYQNTYYGNGYVTAAAVATIEELETPGYFDHINAMSKMLCDGMVEITKSLDIPFYPEYWGGLVGFNFGPGPYENYDQLVATVDQPLSVEFRKRMVENGEFISGNAFRRLTVSHAHTAEVIGETLNVAEKVLKDIRKGV